ncbi:MAG: hypothetical protein MUO50_05210 [Longimicrobiales bacterium]|nr:hypothetical protein [Longimicrobiales bacterium]
MVATNHRLGLTDTRVQAAIWLEREAAGRVSTVFQSGARWGWLRLPLPLDSLEALVETAARARPVAGLERLKAFSLRQAEARLAEGARRPVGFRTVAYDSVVGFDGETPPEWIVALRSPLDQYSMIPDGLEALLQDRYEAVRTFRASLPGEEGWYDQHDAFFLPFKGIRTVARPGPDVTLYHRTNPSDSVASPPDPENSPEEAP